MPEFIVQPRPQQRTTHWGELKRCRSFNLTDTAIELITAGADRAGVNRSEWIERKDRQRSIACVAKFNRSR